VGVPAVIGAGGMEKIIEVPLNDAEKAAFKASVAAVRDMLGTL
jgi:malate dehydrogenase